MPLALIKRMRKIVAAARAANAGFWPVEDLTAKSRLQLHGLDDLSTLVMFPKLYRRLVAYFKAGHADLAAFDTWLRADPIQRDDRVLLPTGELGNLHNAYDVNQDGIILRHLPEELMFDPAPVAPCP
jgi:hypothetical protein